MKNDRDWVFWDAYSKANDLKYKMLLEALNSSDDLFIKELREDARWIVNDPDLSYEIKKKSIDIILETIREKRKSIERREHIICGN